ncbi:M81 family metallopeptidase [Sinomonas sp. JGH33]|uniref:M81 family metallopeptidase n=1 Tax=Sinomonas terricola TaxID=3110330 RepID=A0ABU5TC56_9MICC|nr:M81 family metallopeptidase [Sinomonas sp. JGH33]MEA5457269.1 M81 family metallopeptidase [Sinomonas sp. JGH33]
MSRPRIAVAGMWHETNIYGPHAATLDRFDEYELLEGDDIIGRHRGVKTVIGGFLDGIHRMEAEAVPTLSAGAWPGGPAPRHVMNALLDRLRQWLALAMQEGPLAGVLLNLHGAMTAEGFPDVEAETVRAARSIVGPETPVGAVLDLHANPTPAFVEQCNVVICYDTYPHVDMWDRGLEVATLIGEAVQGRRLRTAIRRTPLLTVPPSQGTADEPMKGIRLRADQKASMGTERVSICAGFAYTLPERIGLSALVVHDEDRTSVAEHLAEAVVADIDACAEQFKVTRPTVAEAVAEALAEDATTPVILADLADNIGGGSAGDGTALLAALLDRGARGALAIIADPEVAALAHASGEDTTITCRLGGKSDSLHGAPIEVTARVARTTPGVYTASGSYMTGQTFRMGPTAVLEIGDGAATVLVNTRPTPPFHREQFTHAGVDPSQASVIVAKGALAWRSAYGEDAGTVIEVDTPGACALDVEALRKAASEPRP